MNRVPYVLCVLFILGCAGPQIQVRRVDTNGHDLKYLLTELENVEKWIDWCDAHPQGGAVPDGYGTTGEIRADKMPAMKAELQLQRTLLQKHIKEVAP